jgi:bacillithiol biosynthesis deacetylase BshB1
MFDVLAIGSHPDDVEIAMGGTIAKMVRQGFKVGVLDLTDGEPTPAGSPEIRAAEMRRAAEVLRVERRITLDMPNRWLFDSVENRKKVAAVLREHRPKVMVCHHWDDAHPDHVEAHKLCVAARFTGKYTKTDMPGEPYYVPHMVFFGLMHLQYAFKPSFIVALDEQDFERKVEALACYESQGAARAWLDRVRTYNAYFGGLIGQPYGEPFVSKTEVGLESLDSLL